MQENLEKEAEDKKRQENLDIMLETIHIPENAGEYADDIRKILSRIPPRWGRWISCDKGWYPLVIELDQKLVEIYPDYQLHQVKEKFGTLRYYIGFPDLQPQCCIDLDAEQPIEGPINPRWRRSDQTRTVEEQYTLDKWFYEVRLPHFDTPEHIQQDELLEPERQRRWELSQKMQEIIQDYEDLSARTCELCGAEAELRARRYWYRTLCESCAEKDGYMPIPDEDPYE
jgi:hypothetical protein